MRLDLRLESYRKLVQLAAGSDGGQPESMVAVIERLIDAARLPESAE